MNDNESKPYRFLRKQTSKKDNTGSMSQSDVEEVTGIDRNLISTYEKGEKIPSPEDIVCLSRCFKSKRLCHWYCASECPVGSEINLLEVDPIHPEDFAQVMMTIHSSIRKLNKIDLNSLIDISQDGIIEKSELETYNIIKDALADLGKAYGALLRIEEDDINGDIIYRHHFTTLTPTTALLNKPIY